MCVSVDSIKSDFDNTQISGLVAVTHVSEAKREAAAAASASQPEIVRAIFASYEAKVVESYRLVIKLLASRAVIEERAVGGDDQASRASRASGNMKLSNREARA